MATTHDLYDALLIHHDLVPYPALAGKIQDCTAAAREADVPVAKRCDAEAVIDARVFGVADARR